MDRLRRPDGAGTGRFVLVYRLLWELTHLRFEDHGLLTRRAENCTEDVRTPAATKGRLGEVVLEPAEPMARLVQTATGEEWVDLAVVGGVDPSTWRWCTQARRSPTATPQRGGKAEKITAHESESTSFLYPSIEADGETHAASLP